MLEIKYDFFNKFSIVLKCNGNSGISNYFHEEYKNFPADQYEKLDVIGSLIIKEKINVPITASILTKDKVFILSNVLYFQYEGCLISISLTSDTFVIYAESSFNQSVVFYINEILIRLYASKFGIVFLHASAFNYKNETYLINAFGGTGKTNLVLDAIFSDGTYLADDLCAIDQNSNIYPYTKSINLLDYNFDHNKELIQICNKNPVLYSILKLIKKLRKNTKFYTFLISKIEWRLKIYFNYKISAGKIKKQLYKNKYKVTKFIWLERNEGESKVFKIDEKILLSKMKFCLELENRSFLDFFGYLKLCYPNIELLKNTQNDIITNIIKSNKLVGFKKNEKDEKVLFKYITNIAK